MKSIYRVFSLLLCLALVLGTLFCLPLTATAASDEGISFNATYQYRTAKKCDATPNTFEAWIKLPKGASGSRAGIILGNYGDASPCINFEIHPNGRPRLYWNDTNGTSDWIFTDVNVCTGEWLHLAIVRDAAAEEVRCYVDGELASTISITKKTRDLICVDPFVLGGDHRVGNSMYFRGSILSAVMYSDVRTEDEISDDMLYDPDPDDDAMIAYFDLSDVEEDGSVADLSGNGYDITKGKQPAAWLSASEVDLVTDYDYTFVAVGDTQVLAQKHQDRFHLIYDWILDNKEEKNIEFVFGLGDITETSSAIEWELAMENILRMEGEIPFSLVRGNHDSTATFNHYFPYDDYAYLVDDTFDDSMINSWQELTVGARDFIIFTLDYGASDAVLNWASDVIEQHPDHNVILTTHCYLFRDGTTLDQGDVCPPATTGGHNNGDHMWDKLVRKHENIVLVLNGHDPCSRIVTAQDEGDHGNIVTQMLIDPQGVDASQSGAGLVAVLHFSEDSSEVQVEYYSTFKQKYFKTENQFTVTLDFVNEDEAPEAPPEQPEQPEQSEQPTTDETEPAPEQQPGDADSSAKEQTSFDFWTAAVGAISSLVAVGVVAVIVVLLKRRNI